MKPSTHTSPQNPLDLSLWERLLRQELRQKEQNAQDADALWAKIEAGLQEKNHKKRRVLWFPIGMAASLLAGLIAWQILDKTPKATTEPVLVVQSVENAPIKDFASENQAQKNQTQEKNQVARATLSETEASLKTEASTNQTSKNKSITSISVQKKNRSTQKAQPDLNFATAQTAEKVGSEKQESLDKDAFAQAGETQNTLLTQNNATPEPTADSPMESPWTQGKNSTAKEGGRKMHITIKFGQDDEPTLAKSQPSELNRAKAILKEAWNLKAGKRVEWRNILPENSQTKSY
jgi:hypothetical protein